MAFKMKGNPMKRNFGKHIPKYKVELEGIDNNDTQKNLKDGKAPSSAFQYHDDTKKGSQGWETSHWPDGKERSAREIWEYENLREEERKDEERQQAVTRKPEPMMKAKSPMKATYEEAIKKDPKLAEYIAYRKTVEKGSNEWKKNQNKINAAYGNSKRYEITPEKEEVKTEAPKPEPKVKERGTITGGTRTRTEYDKTGEQVDVGEGGHRRGGKTEIERKDVKGRKRRVVTKTKDKKVVTRYDKEGNVKSTKEKAKNYRQKKEKSPAKHVPPYSSYLYEKRHLKAMHEGGTKDGKHKSVKKSAEERVSKVKKQVKEGIDTAKKAGRASGALKTKSPATKKEKMVYTMKEGDSEMKFYSKQNKKKGKSKNQGYYAANPEKKGKFYKGTLEGKKKEISEKKYKKQTTRKDKKRIKI